MLLRVNTLLLKSDSERLRACFIDQSWQPFLNGFEVFCTAKVLVMLLVRARVLDKPFEVPPCKVLLGKALNLNYPFQVLLSKGGHFSVPEVFFEERSPLDRLNNRTVIVKLIQVLTETPLRQETRLVHCKEKLLELSLCAIYSAVTLAR